MPGQGKKPPNALTPTDGLSREEWLAFRRKGIGLSLIHISEPTRP